MDDVFSPKAQGNSIADKFPTEVVLAQCGLCADMPEAKPAAAKVNEKADTVAEAAAC